MKSKSKLFMIVAIAFLVAVLGIVMIGATGCGDETVPDDRRSIAIPTAAVLQFTYDGTAQGITVTESVDYTISGEQKNTNAGTYTVTISLKDKETTKWSNDKTDDVKIVYTIAKANNTWTTEYAAADYTVGNTPTITEAVSKFGAITYGYFSDEACTTAVTGMSGFTAQTPVGVYYVKVSVAGTDNYNALSKVYDVTVANETVAKPTVSDTEFTYNGSAQGIEIAESDKYTISGDLKNTNAGTYTVTVALADNYAWADGSTDELTFTYTIAKANNTWTTEYAAADYTVGNTPTVTEAVSKFGEVTYGYFSDEACTTAVTGMSGFTAQTPVGVYYVKVSVAGTDNYNALSKVYDVTVANETVAKPTVSDTEFTYNGSEQGIEIAESDKYTISGDLKSTNAGTYTVTVALADNYAWADGSTDELTFTYTIAKVSIVKPSLIATTFAYTSDEIVAYELLANAKFTVDGNTGTNAGEYGAVFKLTDKDNYAWADGSADDIELAWSITKSMAIVSNEEELKTAIADENYNTIQLAENIVAENFISIERSVTIDLNGKEITYNGVDSYLNDKGSTIYHHAIHIVGEGNAVTIKNGSLKTGERAKNSVAILSVGKAATLSIDGVVATSIGYGIVTGANAKVNIKGGSVQAQWHALTTNNTNGAAGYTVDGAEIVSTDDSAIFMSCYTAVSLTNTIVKGKTAIDMRIGDLIIDGGEIISTKEEFRKMTYAQVTSSGTLDGGDGSAIAVRANFYYDNAKKSNAISIVMKNDPQITGAVTVYNINDAKGMLTGKENVIDQMPAVLDAFNEYGDLVDPAAVYPYEVLDGEVISVYYDEATGKVKTAYVANEVQLRASTNAGFPLVKFANDIKTTEVIKFTKELTLDLNGKTVTVAISGVDTISRAVAFRVNAGGNLTVIDSSESGSGTLDASYTDLNIENGDYVAAIGAMGGELTIKGGTFVINSEYETVVYVGSGKATINGGTFTNLCTKEYAHGGGTPLTVNVSNSGSVDSLVVNGGTFKGRSPELGDDALGGNFVAQGKKVLADLRGNGIYTVANIDAEGQGEDYTAFYDIDGTILAEVKTEAGLNAIIAANVGTIMLTADIKADVVIAEVKDVTLDLNGHTLTNVKNHTITNNGTLTIIDSSEAKTGTIDNVTHAKAALYNYAGATVNVESGKFTRSAEAGTPGKANGNSWYVVYNAGAFNMTGGEILGTSGYSSTFINVGKLGAKAIANIDGGKITGQRIAIKNDDFGVMTITNGTFEITANATNNSKGSEVFLNAAVANISGGTFTSYALSNGSIIYNLGYAHDGLANEAVLTITGGTFQGKTEATIGMLYQASSEGVKYIAKPEVSITGGIFDCKIEDIDYKVYGSASSEAELKKLIEVGVNVVTLANDIKTTEVIKFTKELTLDLNGKTVTVAIRGVDTVSRAVAFRVNAGGNLTVIDSSESGSGTLDASYTDLNIENGNYVAAIGAMGGELTIKGGTFVINSEYETVVYVGSGKATINGGTFTNLCTKEYAHGGGTPLTVNVSNSGSVDSLVVKGGTFNGRNPAFGDDKNGGTFVADGYNVIADVANNKYVVISNDDTAEGKDYTIFHNEDGTVTAEVKTEAGLKAVVNIQSVMLKNDMTITSSITMHGQIIVPEGEIVTLTVLENCELVSDYADAFVVNKGSLTLDGKGSIYTTDIADQGRHAIANYGKIVINDGIYGSNASRGNAIRNFGEAVINGGSFTACDNFTNGGYAYAIASGSKDYQDATMTINYAVAYGKVNGMLGCDGGTMIVNGGEYTLGTGTESNLHYMAYSSNNGKVTITGGKFTRNVSDNKPYFLNNVVVSGGDFNSDVTANCVEGYACIKVDSTWRVTKENIARIVNNINGVTTDGNEEFVSEDVTYKYTLFTITDISLPLSDEDKQEIVDFVQVGKNVVVSLQDGDQKYYVISGDAYFGMNYSFDIAGFDGNGNGRFLCINDLEF